MSRRPFSYVVVADWDQSTNTKPDPTINARRASSFFADDPVPATALTWVTYKRVPSHGDCATVRIGMSRTPSEAAKEQLLRTTAEILREHGIDAVTIEGVARPAGAAKTTLYQHFGGLDALIFAAAAASVIDSQDVDTGSLIGDLRAIRRHDLDVSRSSINRGVSAWMLTRAMHSP